MLHRRLVLSWQIGFGDELQKQRGSARAREVAPALPAISAIVRLAKRFVFAWPTPFYGKLALRYSMARRIGKYAKIRTTIAAGVFSRRGFDAFRCMACLERRIFCAFAVRDASR